MCVYVHAYIYEYTRVYVHMYIRMQSTRSHTHARVCVSMLYIYKALCFKHIQHLSQTLTLICVRSIILALAS